MTNRKLTFIRMSFKSLVRKRSFWLCIALIPLFVLFVSVTSKDDSGVLKIGVLYEDSDPAGKEIAESLINDDHLIYFFRAENEESSIHDIVRGRLDALWIFEGDTESRMREYFTGKSKDPFVRVFEREGSITLFMSHEFLYGAMYPKIAYIIYEDFVERNLVPKAEITEEQIKEAYAKHADTGSIVVFDTVEGGKAEQKTDYLTLPLRGLLSLTVLLCALAGALYYRHDLETGKYNCISAKKRLFPAYATVFPAAFICGAAVYVTLVVSSQVESAAWEALAMALYIWAVTSVGVLFGLVIPSVKALGAVVPMYMLTCTLISPIFYNLPMLTPIMRFLPNYHYLASSYNKELLMSLGIFAAVITVLTFVADKIRARLA